MEQVLLDKLIAANQSASVTANSSTVELLVSNISGWKAAFSKSTNQPLDVVMVVTDKGNYWPLKSAIKNMPTDFSTPRKAKAVVTVRKDKAGVERLNLSSLEFEGLKNETALAIQQLPKGTALFASFQ